MIYTVTLNPAIDYVMHIPALAPGHIMRSQKEETYFGGKGINVSLILKALGVPSTALGFLAGFTGKAIAEGIACNEITCDFVHLPEGLTRINVKLRSGEETDINGSGPAVPEASLQEMFRKINNLQADDVLVLSGSIPGTMPKDTYARMLELLKDRQVKFVIDAEKELLTESLAYSPFLIKPNKEELEQLFAVTLTTTQDILPYARQLQQMGAQNVLVSLGGDGALLLDAKGNTRFLPAVKGEFINSVGAGDSMVAGFLAGYLQTQDFAFALKLGTAAGGATACSAGLADQTKIQAFLQQI